MMAALLARAQAFARAFRVSLRSTYSYGSVPAVIAQVIVEPVVDMLLYLMLAWAVAEAGGAEGVSAAALAAAVGSCAAKVVGTTTTVFMSDRYEGALPFVFSASGGTGTVVAARLACAVAVGAMSCGAALLALGALGVFPTLGARSAALLLGLVLACCAVSAAIGLAIYAVSLMARDELLVLNVFGYLLPLACGSVAAVSAYPAPVAAVCSLVPISGITEAARALAAGDDGRAVAALAAAVALGLLWTLAGLLALRVGIRRQRRSGRVDVLGL